MSSDSGHQCTFLYRHWRDDSHLGVCTECHAMTWAKTHQLCVRCHNVLAPSNQWMCDECHDATRYF